MTPGDLGIDLREVEPLSILLERVDGASATLLDQQLLACSDVLVELSSLACALRESSQRVKVDYILLRREELKFLFDARERCIRGFDLRPR